MGYLAFIHILLILCNYFFLSLANKLIWFDVCGDCQTVDWYGVQNSEEPIFADFWYVQITIDFVSPQLITISLDVLNMADESVQLYSTGSWNFQRRLLHKRFQFQLRSQAHLTNDWLWYKYMLRYNPWEMLRKLLFFSLEVPGTSL